MSAAPCDEPDAIVRIDWNRVADELDAEGSAVLQGPVRSGHRHTCGILFHDAA